MNFLYTIKIFFLFKQIRIIMESTVVIHMYRQGYGGTMGLTWRDILKEHKKLYLKILPSL